MGKNVLSLIIIFGFIFVMMVIRHLDVQIQEKAGSGRLLSDAAAASPGGSFP